MIRAAALIGRDYICAVAHEDANESASWLVSKGRQLRLDSQTADVLRCFAREGVRYRLLKGRATTSWLYPDDFRGYEDCDLLVAPTDTEAAATILESLGLERELDERQLPEWWREHASAWVRDDGFSVDVHRTLPGVGVDHDVAWTVLSRGSDLVDVGGHPARALTLPARALHVALHAAHHGVGWSLPMTDLRRALTVADEALWRAAAQLSRELEATDAFVAGLRLVAAGVELADRLRLPSAGSVQAQLHAEAAPPVALGFEQLAQADGMTKRAAIVYRKLVPPPEFIRHWDPRASESRSALILAYIRRPLWLFRHAPRGWQAWRRARQSADAPTNQT